MRPYRGWRLTVFVVSIFLAVFAPSTIAVIVANLLFDAPDSASHSGAAPTSDTASTPSCPTEASERGPTVDSTAVIVDVYNAADVDGQAQRVSDKLKDHDFTPGKVKNAPEKRESSVVRYAPGELGAGCRVAEELGRLPVEAEWARNVYWMYALVVQPEFGITRDQLMEQLRVNGIDTRTFFCPMNQQPCLQSRPGFRDVPCQVADRLWETGLYLPSSYTLADDTLLRIADKIRQASRREHPASVA